MKYINTIYAVFVTLQFQCERLFTTSDLENISISVMHVAPWMQQTHCLNGQMDAGSQGKATWDLKWIGMEISEKTYVHRSMVLITNLNSLLILIP